jgi:glycosyltransferase involved in cell wall biosynthesis
MPENQPQSDPFKDSSVAVSVVIPCFNHAPFLEAAIASVRAQTRQPQEIIVVDDGSSDGSAHIARELGVTVLEQTNSGPSAARNAGIRAASGDVIVFLDADDLMREDCIEARVKLLQSQDGVGMVVGAFDLVDAEGQKLPFPTQLPSEREVIDEREALRLMNCPTCGLLVRSSVFQAVGGFDESLRIGEDSELLLRVSRKYKCLVDPEPRAYYRQVDQSLSRDYVLWFDSFRTVIGKQKAGLAGSASLASLTCDRVFGKMLKDRAGGSFGSQVRAALKRRPVLAFYFGLWVARAAYNRALWAMGKGPLRKRAMPSE